MSKILGKFTGWQITAMVCTALMVPTGIYAAVTYSNVSIVNPTSGVHAFVDAAGRLLSYDALAQYRNNPANYVDIRVPMYNAHGCSSASYVIPTGKALIITSIKGNYYNADASSQVGFWIMGNADCSGSFYFNEYEASSPTVTGQAKNYEFGSGLPIPAGSVSFFSDNDLGWTVVQGYLVPAALVSASSYSYPATPGRALRPAASSK